MKKSKKATLLIIAILFIAGVLLGYKNLSKNKYYDVKKAVWNQLSEQEKASVLPDWEKAK